MALRVCIWLVLAISLVCDVPVLKSQAPSSTPGKVVLIELDMMILPGTQYYLEESIERAQRENAELLIVQLDTPGGMLNVAQDMTQLILNSPVPIVVFVGPSGATATSAGVFVTMAGHISVMAPGTTIGAAHPVAGDGSDIEGDMRKKAEEITSAMARSIAEQRGRNVEWAEKAVKESASMTEREAVEQGVVDLTAASLEDLLLQIEGREVSVVGEVRKISNVSSSQIEIYEMGLTDQFMNVLSNPQVAAFLWVAATTGITLELYSPGAILPGTVGVICLILALLVSQVIPVSYGGLMLLILGAGLLVTELYTGSLILGVGGVIALVLGALYLFDTSLMPGIEINYTLLAAFVVMSGAFLFWAARVGMRVRKSPLLTGHEGLIGQKAEVVETISKQGKVFIDGEYWEAVLLSGIVHKGDMVEVIAVRSGMVLEIAKPHGDQADLEE